MRFRVNFGIFAPSLAQLWTTFKSESDKENEFGLPAFLPQCGKWDGNWDGYVFMFMFLKESLLF